MDKDTLKKIAELTEAKFYEAENKDKLISIYDEIDPTRKNRCEPEALTRFMMSFINGL